MVPERVQHLCNQQQSEEYNKNPATNILKIKMKITERFCSCSLSRSLFNLNQFSAFDREWRAQNRSAFVGKAVLIIYSMSLFLCLDLLLVNFYCLCI